MLKNDSSFMIALKIKFLIRFIQSIFKQEFSRMPRVDITLKNATRIPLLGVKTQPSPYVIIECEQATFTSSIAKYSQNPIWNFHTIIEAKKLTSLVTFYIYNNNPNAVDELLAFGKIEFGQLMTRTNTTTKLKLVNSLEEPIYSFIFVEHYDCNPQDIYLPLGERSCIKLRLISEINPDSYFICEYGESSFNLSSELKENAFRYDAKYQTIKCTLRINANSKDRQQQLQNQLLISNIAINSILTLRFYSLESQIKIFLSASLITNGLLPQNYNILNAKLVQVGKSQGKKNSNYRARVIGPLNETIFNQNGQSEVYVENSSIITIEYFQDIQDFEGLEPYCVFKIPINSLNWSNESLQATHTFKFYDTFKSTETSLKLNFMMKKNTQFSKVVPKLSPSQVIFDENSNVFIDIIKIQNSHLYQIIKDHQVQILHVNKRGIVRSFGKFIVSPNKIEYTLQTRQQLQDGGKGTLYMIDMDQQFTDKPSQTINDSIILKLTIENINKIEDSKVDYSSKFLSYAKKASVVNVCKKFNQMVHDDLLKLKFKSKYIGDFKKGILKLINIRCKGPTAGKVSASIIIDSVACKWTGQIGNYLMQRNNLYYVSEGSIQIKVSLQDIPKDDPSLSGKKKVNQICFSGDFYEFFGTPNSQKIYSQELKLTSDHKIQIIYSFSEGEKLFENIQPSKAELSFFDPKQNIKINLKKAFVPINHQQYRFKISRGTFIHESLSYSTNNNKISFQQSEKILLQVDNGQQINPLFFSAYSYDEENKLIIYNGYVNTKDFVGKGVYQIELVYQKQDKRKSIFLLLQTSQSGFWSEKRVGLLKINKIALNTSKPILRNIYKHYLAVKINNFNCEIIECTLQQKQLLLKTSIYIQKLDIVSFELYVSYKAISKQLFYESQKQIVSSGQITSQEIEDTGCFVMNYYPRKQSYLKYSKNSLILQERSFKFYFYYTFQPSPVESRIAGLKHKVSNIQIDVFSRGLLKLFIKQYHPINIDSKIVSIQLSPIRLNISTQGNFKVNKLYTIKAQNMQYKLQAIITLKQGQKYKRISSQSIVNLRGLHYKINQPVSAVINFQQYFYLTANMIIFYNKFVSNPKGQLMLKEVSFRGIKVQQFEVFYQQKITKQQKSTSVIKKSSFEIKNCDIPIKTNDLYNSFQIVLQSKFGNAKQLIFLAQINIDREEEDFIYQRQIIFGNNSVICSLKLNYKSIKINQQKQMSIKYPLNTTGQIIVPYQQQEYCSLQSSFNINNTPTKSQGLLLKLTLPKELVQFVQQVAIVDGNNNIVPFHASISKGQQYLIYSSKMFDIKNIQMKRKDSLEKGIENLGKVNGLWKFMVDQNPKLICTLSQSKSQVLMIDKQSWTFKINLHRLISISKKRLLSLKNAPNDEILTKQLAVLIKHGKQHHFIRGFDQFGKLINKNKTSKQVQFGIDSKYSTIDIFLLVDNYFSRLQSNNLQKLQNNWMELMPISYVSVNLSDIIQRAPCGYKFQSLENTSIHLEKAINKLIIRQQDSFCLFDVQFNKKSWGYIQFRLVNVTPITLANKKNDECFVYFRLQIQDQHKNIVQSLMTQPRLLSSSSNMQFTNDSLSYLFIQESIQSHYNLKIIGNIIQSSTQYSFIQKKQQLTDYLSKKGQSNINIQIKASETSNIIQNTFQICIQIKNSQDPTKKINIIEKAKAINSVDALSFREISTSQFLQRLLGCQQLSHFKQCLQQIKQSFIYAQDPQQDTFIYLTEYLSYSYDSNLIAQICEIIHLNLLKYPQIISQLQDRQITDQIYSNCKLICQRQRRKVPSKITTVSNQQYISTINKFKEDKNILTLRNVIQKQAYRLYTSQQMLSSLSSKNNEPILNIIILLLKYSKIIQNNLYKQIAEWIETFGFTTENSQFELFVLLLKNCMIYGMEFEDKILYRFIQILLQRIYSLSMVFDFWLRLKDPSQRKRLYVLILSKYEGQFGKSTCIETCRGLKMMLSEITSTKSSQENIQMNKLHSGLVKNIIKNLNSNAQIMFISSQLQFASFLLEHKILEQQQKQEISKAIKQRINSAKDNSSKTILSNYALKFGKSKQNKTNANKLKKDSEGSEAMNRPGFYKKYLITTD